jgi:peptide/nickel transport system substrate-binding protein
MFSEVGVELKIVPTEFPAKWIEEVFRNKDFDMTIVAHAEPLDIEIYGRETYYFNYKSQAFRASSPRSPGPRTRRPAMAKYAEAQKMLAQTCRRCSCSSCRSSASGTPS